MSKPESMSNEELDQAVAVEVMGWEAIDRKAAGWGEGPQVWSTGNEDVPTYQGFDPSTSIEAAWSVVEAMARRGHNFDMGTPHTRPNQYIATWYARFTGTIGEPIRGDTAPRAICLAALTAARGASR